MELYIIDKIRTNNYFDMKMMEKTKKIWEDAKESLKDYNGTIYGVYYNYQGDYKGDYDLGIGIESEYIENYLEKINIEDIEYKIYTVNANEEFGVFNAWHGIWEEEDRGELARDYKYDYEKYYNDGKIEIYIGEK